MKRREFCKRYNEVMKHSSYATVLVKTSRFNSIYFSAYDIIEGEVTFYLNGNIVAHFYLRDIKEFL